MAITNHVTMVRDSWSTGTARGVTVSGSVYTTNPPGDLTHTAVGGATVQFYFATDDTGSTSDPAYVAYTENATCDGAGNYSATLTVPAGSLSLPAGGYLAVNYSDGNGFARFAANVKAPRPSWTAIDIVRSSGDVIISGTLGVSGKVTGLNVEFTSNDCATWRDTTAAMVADGTFSKTLATPLTEHGTVFVSLPDYWPNRSGLQSLALGDNLVDIRKSVRTRVDLIPPSTGPQWLGD